MSRHVGPMRKVVKPRLKAGGLIMMQRRGGGPKCRWWELELDCGHRVERGVRYDQSDINPWARRRGWALIHHPPPMERLRPAPGRARCDYCPKST